MKDQGRSFLKGNCYFVLFSVILYFSVYGIVEGLMEFQVTKSWIFIKNLELERSLGQKYIFLKSPQNFLISLISLSFVIFTLQVLGYKLFKIIVNVCNKFYQFLFCSLQKLMNILTYIVFLFWLKDLFIFFKEKIKEKLEPEVRHYSREQQT
jgi:hypothetical protein